MFTLTVSRADVTSEVAEVLRNGLGPQYNVAPGERITRNPFGHPHPDQPNAISVGKGSNAVIRAEVNIIGCSGHSQLRIPCRWTGGATRPQHLRPRPEDPWSAARSVRTQSHLTLTAISILGVLLLRTELKGLQACDVQNDLIVGGVSKGRLCADWPQRKQSLDSEPPISIDLVPAVPIDELCEHRSYRLEPAAKIRRSRYRSSTRGTTNTRPHQRPVAQSTTTMTVIQTASSSRITSDDFRCRRSQFIDGPTLRVIRLWHPQHKLMSITGADRGSPRARRSGGPNLHPWHIQVRADRPHTSLSLLVPVWHSLALALSRAPIQSLGLCALPRPDTVLWSTQPHHSPAAVTAGNRSSRSRPMSWRVVQAWVRRPSPERRRSGHPFALGVEHGTGCDQVALGVHPVQELHVPGKPRTSMNRAVTGGCRPASWIRATQVSERPRLPAWLPPDNAPTPSAICGRTRPSPPPDRRRRPSQCSRRTIVPASAGRNVTETRLVLSGEAPGCG